MIVSSVALLPVRKRIGCPFVLGISERKLSIYQKHVFDFRLLRQLIFLNSKSSLAVGHSGIAQGTGRVSIFNQSIN